MELMSVSDWLWGVRERGEPRTMVVLGYSNMESPFTKNRHRERTGLGREDYHFRRLTLRWDVQCMSLRFRRQIRDRDNQCGSCQHMDGNSSFSGCVRTEGLLGQNLEENQPSSHGQR